MKLLSIKLSFFRQHIQSEITLPDGLIGFIGNNGSGKSTIVEALTFALYGTKALRGKKDDAVTYEPIIDSARQKNQETVSREQTSVTLKFEHAGLIYRIERSLEQAELFFAGQNDPLVAGNQAVSAKIAEILGLNLEEFIASYYTEQKSLDFLSNKKTGADRERFIAKMLGYDQIEAAQKLLREDRRDLKNQIIGMSAGLKSREEISDNITREQNDLVQLQADEAKTAKHIAQADLKLSKLKTLFEEQKEEAVKYEKLSLLAENVTLQERTLSRQKAEITAKLNDLNAALKAQLKSTGLADLSEVNDLVVKSEAIIEQETIKLKQFSDEYGHKKVAAAAEENQLKQEIAVRQSLVATAKARLTTHQGIESAEECPTCGQELGEQHAEIIAAQQGALEAAREEEKNLRTKLASQQESAAKNLKVFEQSFLAPEKTRREASATLEIITQAQSKLQQAEVHRLRLGETETELKTNQAEQEKITVKLEKLGFNTVAYEQKQSEYRTAESLLQTLRLQKVRQEGASREKKALLERTEKELLNYDQRSAELGGQKKQRVLLDESDQVLTNFRQYLNETIRPQISDLASNYLNELSDGRYNEVHLTSDFTPQITEDGITKTVISGGEQDLINLCLRLALSSLITARSGQVLSFLILDEVFGALDENRRQNVLILLERLRNRFEQILIITHLDDIKDTVGHLIYVYFDQSEGTQLFVNEQSPYTENF